MYGREPRSQQAYFQTQSSSPMTSYSSSAPSGHRHSNSTSSQSSRSKRENYGHNPAVESAVTRLLVAIKQLLEALTQWSNGRISEIDVSDVYVRLGNDFNAAVAAFGQFNIDMSELMSVPDDLRNVLETCLAEDATPANLEAYLPDVRKIITNLLQGLRSKQSVYRRTVSDRARQHSSSSSHGDSPRTFENKPSEQSSHERTRSGSRGARKSGSSRRKGPLAEEQLQTESPVDDGEWTGGPTQSEYSPTVTSSDRIPAASSRSRRNQSGGSVTYTPMRQDLPPPAEEEESIELASQPPNYAPTTAQLPPNMIRYSLSDRPVPPSPSAVPQDVDPPLVTNAATPPADESTFAPENDTIPATDSPSSVVVSGTVDHEAEVSLDLMRAPAVESSLAALKKSEALERRASKRFSSYTFTKMTGTRDKGLPALDKLGGIEIGRRNRRSTAFGGNLTPGDLESLAEETESPTKSVRQKDQGRNDRSNSGSRKSSRGHSPVEETPPPLPPFLVPPPVVTDNEFSIEQKTEPTIVSVPSTTVDTSVQDPPLAVQNATVFLKLGLQVKKVTLDKDSLSIPSLRLQFMEKFSYNPGMENFPAIYINDPTSHIQYELEDMEEIKDKSLLSLNIEPLDQVKQHIDLQISNLTQEIKDLKSTVGSARRHSFTPQAPVMAIPEPAVVRPSEGQFANVARRVAQRLSFIHHEDGTPRLARVNSDQTPRRSQSPQPFGHVLPQLTGSSVAISDIASSRIVSDLKTQYDEVQNLRRDLGVVRQLYTDFMSQTKESLGTLRSRTAVVRQLAVTKVGGARAYIDSGKANLDTRSQNVLTKIEELQDTVETLKHDVLKRHISPKPTLMRTLKADVEATAKELGSLTELITTVKPMWKKTWEEELQNIVEEQQFLSHQEEFMGDLLEDHKALLEVYGHIEKVISIRGASGGSKSRTPFRPPPMEDGHTGLSTVMLEIRGAAVDPERRLKAIEANQRNREKELASRSDEFQAELNGFVQGKRLKMTGGAEETERRRQMRNDITLRQMFSQGNTSAPSLMAESDLSAPVSSIAQ